MKRRITLALGLTLSGLLSLSCVPGPNGNTPLPRVVASYIQYPMPPFAISISANRTTGIVGTTFTLTGTVSGAAEPLQLFAWQADNNSTSDAQQFSVSFNQPGIHTVRLAVRDAQGRGATNDILLTVFDPAETPSNVASQIDPTSGFPGTVVQIASGNLLTADGHATVQVGSSASLNVYRPLLGQASFIIPLNAADGIDQPTNIDIKLLIDGQVREIFPFSISPLPVVADPPGQLTRGAVNDMVAATDNMLSTLPQAFATHGLDAEQLAALQGLLSGGSDTLATVRDEIGPMLDQLDADSLRLLDRLGAANGLIDAADRLKKHRARVKTSIRTAKTPGDDLVDALAAVQDAREILKQASNAIQYGAVVFSAFGVFAGPAAPVALSYAATLTSVGTALDLVDIVMELIPKIGDTLEIRVDPPLVDGDGYADVEVHAKLLFSYDPCAKLVETIVSEIAARFAQRLLLKYPPGPWAALALSRLPADARQELTRRLQPFATNNPLPVYYGMPNPPGADTYPLPEVRLIAEFLEKQVEKYARTVVKLARIDNIFDSIYQKACHFNFDFYRPLLGTDTNQMTAEPSSVGTLTADGSKTKRIFQCSGNGGTAVLEAVREIGVLVKRTLRGTALIRCGSDCEEGLGYLATNSVDTQVNCNPSECTGNHVFTLRNMHPERYLIVCVMEDSENVITGGHFYHVDTSTVPPNGSVGPFMLTQCWTSGLNNQVTGKSTHIIQAFVGCKPSGPDPECTDSVGNPVTDTCKQRLIDQWINGSHAPLADFQTRVYPPCEP